MSKYLTSEERANVWTHVPGIILTLALIYPLMRLACQHDWAYLFGTVIFLLASLDMYCSSTFYHLVQPGKTKHILRIFDHSSIFIMIAGCYSVVCTTVLRGWIGWTLFGFLWFCVLVGICSKIFWCGKYPRMSLFLYLLMGWVALVVIWPLWKHMPHPAFWATVIEGLFYSAGSFFFSKDEQYPFFHAIWHVFILLGTIAHVVAVYLILLA